MARPGRPKKVTIEEVILAEGGEMPVAAKRTGPKKVDWHKEALELRKTVQALVKENTQLINEVEATRQNASSAFAQGNKFRDEYIKMQEDYKARLRFCDEQIIAVAKAVGVVVRGEL